MIQKPSICKWQNKDSVLSHLPQSPLGLCQVTQITTHYVKHQETTQYLIFQRVPSLCTSALTSCASQWPQRHIHASEWHSAAGYVKAVLTQKEPLWSHSPLGRDSGAIVTAAHRNKGQK